MRAIAIAGAVSVLVASTVHAQQREPYPGLDAYVRHAMEVWKVPGVALAIVRNDSVLYTKGYGVRSIDSPAPVDAQTLFAIGSNTKSFTAAAIAMLVTDGKMHYDDPVTRYLPTFELYDPWVTRNATVRDLLAHRIGLGRQEAIWYGTGLTRDSVIHQVRYLQPSFSFRYRFGYSNLMYLAVGQAAAAAAGESWDALIHDRLFVPLGMTSSNTSVRDLTGRADVATPHALVHDTTYTMSYRNVDDVGPAGSINSNAADMAQWLRFQLGDGMFGGKRLVGRDPFWENHTPQTIVAGEADPNGDPKAAAELSHGAAYGMGWVVTDYRHHDYWGHTGGIDGMLSMMALLPDQHFGIVILTNQNGTGMVTPVMRWIFDRQLKVEPVTDWNVDLHREYSLFEVRQDSIERAIEGRREPNTTPSLPLADYAGVYRDSTFGTVEVHLANGQLTFTRGELTGRLEHWHHDVFRVHWDSRWLGTTFLQFTVGPANVVNTLTFNFLGDRLVMRHELPADLHLPRMDE